MPKISCVSLIWLSTAEGFCLIILTLPEERWLGALMLIVMSRFTAGFPKFYLQRFYTVEVQILLHVGIFLKGAIWETSFSSCITESVLLVVEISSFLLS